jgi:hypothetical protein
MCSSRVEESIALADWIISGFEKLKVTPDGRRELSAKCYYVAWQHQAAIPRLCRDGLFASATALLRCEWEAYARGMWLHRAASDLAITRFKTERKLPDHKSLLCALEKVDQLPEGSYVEFYDTHYSMLYDFTHTGMEQISMQFDGKDICVQPSDSEVAQLLHFADIIALSTFAQAASMFDRQDMADEAVKRLRNIGVASTDAFQAPNPKPAAPRRQVRNRKIKR